MRKLNFLLVDDSPSTNFYNKVMIEKTEMAKQVKVAMNGAIALDVLKSPYSVDVILLDINMPVMDGWTFLKEFEKLKMDEKVMIILMIGAELPKEKKEQLKSINAIKGCQEKMINPKKVLDIITNFHNDTIVNECISA